MKSLEEEKRLLNLLRNSTITYKNQSLKIILVEKPFYHAGEGKTDIYILLSNGEEIKISSKSKTADFLENKITASRAEQIFGKDWSEIISRSAKVLKKEFEAKQLYYPEKIGRVSAGSYTLGWRLDIINKNTGKLTTPIALTHQQKEEIFLGSNLPKEKRNCQVNGEVVPNSGVANRILVNSEECSTAQEIIDNLIQIEDYSPDCFLTFRAVNYRSKEDKIDGNRPLAVWVDWEKDKPTLVFDTPLLYGAKNDLLKRFKEARR